MLVHHSHNNLHAIVIPPLFEELNFTRAFVADIARALAGRGITTWLPDLPGTGESPRVLGNIGWEDWRDAARTAGEVIAARIGSKPHVIALRGGTLLSDAVDGQSWWSFAPCAGASLLRHLQRTQLISDHRIIHEQSENEQYLFEYAGYPLSAAMQDGLGVATPAALPHPHRIAPIQSTAMPWRRAEPGRDPALSMALAADITGWIVQCERR